MTRIWLVAAALLVLNGCAAQPSPSAPVSSPSAPLTATPTPAKSPPSALVLSSGAIAVIDASGNVLDRVAFDRPVSEVLELIEGTLGQAPAVTQAAEDECTDARDVTYYSWQDYSLTVTHESQPASLASWRKAGAYRIAFGAASVGEIELLGNDSLSVGDDGTALVASLPEDYIDQIAESAVWAVTEAGGSYSNTQRSGEWGLGAIVDNGIVTHWVSPGYVFDTYC